MPANEKQHRFPYLALVGHHRRGHHNGKSANPARVPSAAHPDAAPSTRRRDHNPELHRQSPFAAPAADQQQNIAQRLGSAGARGSLFGAIHLISNLHRRAAGPFTVFHESEICDAEKAIIGSSERRPGAGRRYSPCHENKGEKLCNFNGKIVIPGRPGPEAKNTGS
jgi:hypothetical protein